MASRRLVPRRQALLSARLPAHARRHDVGRDTGVAPHRLRAAREGELDRRCVFRICTRHIRTRVMRIRRAYL